MANMGQMNKPNMIAAQMQRDGSQMDINGQRAQSPNSNENAPSPNKRPRVEGKQATIPDQCHKHPLTRTQYRRHEQQHAQRSVQRVRTASQ
jgi:hypothetical protein